MDLFAQYVALRTYFEILIFPAGYNEAPPHRSQNARNNESTTIRIFLS